MKKTQGKDAFRNIRKNFVSFLAVAIVTMIGCGVHFGSFFYAYALIRSAQEFYRDTNFEDMDVIAIHGISPDEITEIASVDGIVDAEGTYQISDATAISAGEDFEVTVFGVTDRVGRSILLDGTYPDKEGECALPTDAMKSLGAEIGSTIQLKVPSAKEGLLKTDTFVVTAEIEHPEDYRTGKTNYVFLPEDAFDKGFAGDNYTYVRIKADIPAETYMLSPDYNAALLPIKDNLEKELGRLGNTGDEINSAKPAGFVVLTRSEKEGCIALNQIVSILKKLATVFVVIFMAIGVIVVLSTITILIDNQKKLIGSMKAFGFRNREIILKYAVFGVSAVLLGMLLSIALAVFLEQVIAVALAGAFVVQPQRVFFRIGDFLQLLLIELLLAATASTAAAYLNAVRSSAVELMNGVTKEKDIHFTAAKGTGKSLYSRLIPRNARKDAARVICSVIIIAGSCFMMGVGFTMDLAFRKLIVKSPELVTHYDLEVTIPAGTDREETEKLREMLEEEGLEYAEMYKTETRFLHDGREEYASLISGDNAYFGDYVVLSDMNGKEQYTPDTQDVFVPIRLRESFGIQPGEEIIFYDSEMRQHDSAAGDSFRNYIGRNFYVSQDVYQDIFGEDTEKNLFLVRTGDKDKEELMQSIRQAFPKISVERTDTLPDAVTGFWKRVFRTLIIVMTGLSILMAVFVLLNLVSIFVVRRKNELIIMAVNGFTYRQRIGYLLRETVTTTLLGLIFGTAAGCFLTSYLVRVIEPVEAMFDRSIQPLAWLIACGLETIFVLLINFFAFRRVKKYQLTDLTS